MDTREFYDLLLDASKVEEVRDALEGFLREPGAAGTPFGGRKNNEGTIAVAADPARSAIERVTNAVDALLELEHLRHAGRPDCRTPREAAGAWLGVPTKDGLAGLTTKGRQDLALSTVVRLEDGEGWQSRLLTVIDRGIGIEPARMKDTILSLNESNKISKHYLAGTYGQGGSSTLAFSRYVVIASRAYGSSAIGFTVVWFDELPYEEFKNGRYAYLVLDGDVPSVEARPGDPEHGTVVRHFGYDLSTYTSSIGPRSLYGALQRVLFDPIAPVRFENRVAGWNRTIKGARNALNGAVDQGDENARGPDLDHSNPMFSVSLGDLGELGIEYWVLSRPAAKDGKRQSGKPSRAFVDDGKPIILTHNGQNQDELTGRMIRKDADLPFLQAQGRLIVHVNCDRLAAAAKRQLFASTREKSREGFVRTLIEDEIVRALRADDELDRLDDEAREQSMKDQDDAAEKQMQRQVAKLLRIVGPAVVDVGGAVKAQGSGKPAGGKRGPRAKPLPIEPREPPTYVKIVGDKDDDITFYRGQRRYVRVETDANSSYHDPDDTSKSRVNVAVGQDLKVFGTSPLRGGRMRIGVECGGEVGVGGRGSVRIELYRAGLPTLSDERGYLIVEQPQPKDESRQTSFPIIRHIPVDGPGEEGWEIVAAGFEDNDVRRHASAWQMKDGVMYIYYSTAFPRYASERRLLEQQNPSLLLSFKKRYELWLAVHALLVHDDEEKSTEDVADEETKAEVSRQERCRLASISAMVAAQEVKSGVNTEDAEDAA